MLQKEYIKLLEFCFDDEFYPDILGNLYPSQRFSIYASIKKCSTTFSRIESFSMSLRNLVEILCHMDLMKNNLSNI